MVDRKRLQMINVGGPWPTVWPSFLRSWGGTESRTGLGKPSRGGGLSLAVHTAFDRVAPKAEAAVHVAGLRV